MDGPGHSSGTSEVDLHRLSAEEICNVNNPVLREALAAAKEQIHQELSQSYVAHNQHSSHSNTG